MIYEEKEIENNFGKIHSGVSKNVSKSKNVIPEVVQKIPLTPAR